MKQESKVAKLHRKKDLRTLELHMEEQDSGLETGWNQKKTFSSLFSPGSLFLRPDQVLHTLVALLKGAD